MPTIAYYVRENVPATVALGRYKRMAEETGKCFGFQSEEKERIDIVMKQIQNGNEEVEIVQRIKVNVTNLEEVQAIAAVPGFIRFAIGGFVRVEDLIKHRKAEGRSDWYV